MPYVYLDGQFDDILKDLLGLLLVQVRVALGDALHQFIQIIEQRRRGIVDEERPARIGGHYAAEQLLLGAQP